MATIFMPRNKSSIIRSSSTGGRPSYPYPRSHTPLMIIPSTRPVLEHADTSTSRSNTYGSRKSREQEHRPRRRPPLNTAIPTIPESKSNESIMSHISRVSVNNNEKIEVVSPVDAGCVIIENPAAVAGIPRLSTNNTTANTPSSCDVSNNNVSATTAASGGRRREKRGNTMGTSKSGIEKSSASNPSAPLSPLMSVAHSVRNKLSKLTRIRSRSNSTERSNSIKTSQSFSGFRPTPKSKVPPKRIDENANRVIKSSSMDVKLSSDLPSTSKVIIPQNPEPLFSDDESQYDNHLKNNDLTIVQQKLQVVESSNESEAIVEEVESMEKSKDIESEMTMSPVSTLQTPENEVLEIVESKPTNEVVLKAEKRNQIPLSVSFSMEPICVSPSPIVESPGDKENSCASIGKSVESNAPMTSDSKTTTTTTRQVLQATNRQDGMTTTTTTTITTTTTVYNEEGKADDHSEKIVSEKEELPFKPTVPTYSRADKMKRSKSEEQPIQQRFIMTVKTPEALRRHRTFVIGESEPISETEKVILESRKKTKKMRTPRSKSMEDAKSPERFILVTKTPLQLSQKHQTFVIGESEPKTKLRKSISLERKPKEKKKRDISLEDFRGSQRYVMIAKTPLTSRKHQTFVVGDAEPKMEVAEAVTTLEAIVSPKKEKKVRSPSPEEPRSPERYVMIAKTPLTSRKHQTFVVGDAEPKVEVAEAVTTLEAIVSPKKEKKVRLPSPEEPRSPERYVMIAKTPLTSRKHQTFVVGDAEPKLEVAEAVTTVEAIVPPKKEKKVRLPSPEEPRSPERYVMISKTPIASPEHKTFVVGDAEPKLEVAEAVTTAEAIVSPKKEKKVRSPSPEEPRSPERYVMISKTPIASPEHKTFVVGDAEPKLEVAEAVTTLEAIVSPKKERKVRSPSPEEPRSPERYVMIAKTPLTSRKHQTFVVGDAEPKLEVAEAVTTVEAIVSPKKEKKVRSPSPEEPRSPERYVMIAKTPLTSRKHQTFVVGDAEPKLEVAEAVTKVEAIVSPKKEKKVRSPSPEEPRSPERYVMIAKTPLTSRKHQTFVVGDAEPKLEVAEAVTTVEAIVSPKKEKKVRSPSPEEPRSPERYVMIAKTPLTSRKHQTFVVGDAEPKLEVAEAVTTVEAIVSPKKEKKVRSPSPEEPRSPERYVMIAKTPLTSRKHQTFVVGDAEPKLEVAEAVTTVEAIVSPKKEKKVRSPSPEEPRSPERYVMISKTPIASPEHKTFVVGDAEPKLEVAEAVTTVEAIVSPKKEKKVRSPSPEEPRSPERYVMIAKTPLTSRKHQTFVVGDAEPKVEVAEAVTTLEAIVSPKKERKVRSPSPEEPRSPERYVMIAKTPLTSRKHQTFVVGDAEPKLEMAEVATTADVASPKVMRKTKKIVRQRSSPETDATPCERFVLVTKTPLTLRRHHTFVIGERPPSPDVPWIEEGELTEPIATVGPLAHKQRTKSEEPRKLIKAYDDEKPVEKFILTSRTPLAIRKFRTFVVENKQTADIPTSKSDYTDLQRGREVTRVKKEKLKTSSTFTAADRSKSPYEDEVVRSPERFVLTATTPIAMKKFNKFAITEKIHSPEVADTTDDEEDIPRPRMKPSDMYVLTATTPLMTRRGPRGDVIPDEEELIMKSSSSGKETSFSPERTTLFVMGRRSPAMSLERRPDPSSLHLEGIRENSQSDRAERKMSTISGEMTSPEEEIPMDTQQTPSEDEAGEILLPLKSIHIRASPIPEEVIIRREDRPPVFCAPSPPRAITSSKSTSPIKSSESRPEISTSSSMSSTKELSKRERKLAAKADKKREEKDKPAKIPLATRSLRSAGRMFAPSFFRRSERRHQKGSAPPKSMPFSSSRPAMDISFNSPRAPLAEFESTVVENSPMVENHPLTFDKWNNSPWSRRRFGDQTFAQTIKEESDGNGNLNSSSYDRSVASPLLGRHHDHDKGLIDDEILDQPMLVGDTFSHSESMDRLSAVRHMEAFEAEKATLISIDRSFAEEVDSSALTGVAHPTIIPSTSVPTIPSPITRRSDNGNTRPAQSVITPFYTSNVQCQSSIHCNLDQGLNEVKDIKAQLQQLRQFVEQETAHNEDEAKEALIRENDALRRQLIEQDNIIKSLKQQLATLKTV